MRVIEGGSAMARAITYGAAHHNVIQNSIHQQQEARNNLTELGAVHFQYAMDRAKTLVDYSAVAQARAALAQVDSYYQADRIRHLRTIEEVQNAPNSMVRWLMTEPEFRARYHEQRCEGYGTRYRDTQPGKVGADHDDWCRVNSGIIDFEKEEGALLTCYVVGDPEDDTPPLSVADRLDIQFSLDTMRMALLEGRDATDELNSDL